MLQVGQKIGIIQCNLITSCKQAMDVTLQQTFVWEVYASQQNCNGIAKIIKLANSIIHKKFESSICKMD